MAIRRFFCDCCGKEITTEELRYNVAFYNKKEKKQKTMLHLCEIDMKKVRNMKFVPQKNVRLKKMPEFYNIVECHMGKEKSLYVVTAWNLDQILLTMDRKDPTKLFCENGKRYYTKEYVLGRIDGSIKPEEKDETLMKYVQLLFNKQTIEEKAKYETKFHNNVGFNKPDAKFLSAMARESFAKGYASLSPAQIDETKRRFKKYAEQVADLLNEEQEL